MFTNTNCVVQGNPVEGRHYWSLSSSNPQIFLTLKSGFPSKGVPVLVELFEDVSPVQVAHFKQCFGRKPGGIVGLKSSSVSHNREIRFTGGRRCPAWDDQDCAPAKATRHWGPGCLTVCSKGSTMEFSITLGDMSQYDNDGLHRVIGQVLGGFSFLHETNSGLGKPVTISKAGVVPNKHINGGCVLASKKAKSIIPVAPVHVPAAIVHCHRCDFPIHEHNMVDLDGYAYHAECRDSALHGCAIPTGAPLTEHHHHHEHHHHDMHHHHMSPHMHVEPTSPMHMHGMVGSHVHAHDPYAASAYVADAFVPPHMQSQSFVMAPPYAPMYPPMHHMGGAPPSHIMPSSHMSPQHHMSPSPSHVSPQHYSPQHPYASPAHGTPTYSHIPPPGTVPSQFPPQQAYGMPLPPSPPRGQYYNSPPRA